MNTICTEFSSVRRLNANRLWYVQVERDDLRSGCAGGRHGRRYHTDRDAARCYDTTPITTPSATALDECRAT